MTEYTLSHSGLTTGSVSFRLLPCTSQGADVILEDVSSHSIYDISSEHAAFLCGVLRCVHWCPPQSVNLLLLTVQLISNCFVFWPFKKTQFQLLKCEYFLLPFLLSDSKLNIFRLWTKQLTYKIVIFGFWKLWSTFFTISKTKQLIRQSRE